ncbi:hypothetical protein FB45DRAFT_1137931 [Roridomyces roridus]|uniref:F-box domain-containing protein n=1 Tax=Roridomyces roridus TaxID=1738132 RepID=A0AAD7FSU8_9AGAR|nr:hypothetical protein FB45DRAFT_1137931 [Roridomyces roridus]
MPLEHPGAYSPQAESFLAKDVDDVHPTSSTNQQLPISRLFPEILCHIFTLTLPTIEADTPTVARAPCAHYREAWHPGIPWTLGHVCAHWRTLALAYPPLWTTIVLSTANWKKEVYYLNLLLERSGSAPLDIVIRWTSGYTAKFAPDSFNWAVYWEVFRQHARWHSLHIELDGNGMMNDEFRTLGSLPLLRSLTFSGRGSPYPASSNLFFTGAVNLRRVMLSPGGTIALPHLCIPWANLTSYKATDRRPAGNFMRLAAASRLVELDLNFVGDASTKGIGIVTLQSLRRLVISHATFLAHIVAPTLQDLHIRGPSPIEHILPFIHTSNCYLTRITLFKHSSPASQVVHLLRELPTLTGLALDFLGPPPETSALVSALTIIDERGVDGDIICPRLRELSWGDRNDTIDRKAFVEMVNSRWEPGRTGLRFVGLYLGRLRMKTAGLRLKALEREGLEAVVMNAKKGNRVMEGWRYYGHLYT